MKTAYIECSSGVSGDMLNGAFIDCGVPIEYIASTLSTLTISGFKIETKNVLKNGIRAVKFDVIIDQNQPARNFFDIQKIINSSTISNLIKERAIKIFRDLFTIESEIHGTSFDKTHLHELGAIDCIIDICSALICLDFLKIERVITSKINVGCGMVNTAHGRIPIPAPATIELLRGAKVYCEGEGRELTTPTGAAILRSISNEWSAIPEMTLQRIGYGAGSLDLPDTPNVLRIFIGEGEEEGFSRDKINIIETNIDDMTGEVYGYVIERLLEAGAIDVFITPIIMKKCRPAAKLTVITNTKNMNKLSKIIFNETTTIGLRYCVMDRTVLEREIILVTTELGSIRIKVSKIGSSIINISPEYEDCKDIALNKKLPLKTVMGLALKAYNKLINTSTELKNN